MTPDHADHELIRLCEAFQRARAKRLRLCAALTAAGNADPALLAEWEAATAAEDEAANPILDVTPRTLEGLAAKVRVTQAIAERARSQKDPLEWHEAFLDRMMEDLLALLDPREGDAP